MTPDELLAEARRLLEVDPDIAEGSLRLRAATILARQALEGRLDDLLRTRVDDLDGVKFDAKLLVLPAVMGEPELAAETRYVWAALSSASHLHAYELPPTVDELAGWLDSVRRFLGASSRLCG